MRTTIDAAGRVVIPKAVRDALHLEGGTALEVRLHDGWVELEPAATPMRLEPRGRGQVATSEVSLPAIDEDDVRAVIESQRR